MVWPHGTPNGEKWQRQREREIFERGNCERLLLLLHTYAQKECERKSFFFRRTKRQTAHYAQCARAHTHTQTRATPTATTKKTLCFSSLSFVIIISVINLGCRHNVPCTALAFNRHSDYVFECLSNRNHISIFNPTAFGGIGKIRHVAAPCAWIIFITKCQHVRDPRWLCVCACRQKGGTGGHGRTWIRDTLPIK